MPVFYAGAETFSPGWWVVGIGNRRGEAGSLKSPLVYTVCGCNGVLGALEPVRTPAHELCMVVQGVVPTKEMAEEVCLTGIRHLIYTRLAGVTGPAGSVAPLKEYGESLLAEFGLHAECPLSPGRLADRLGDSHGYMEEAQRAGNAEATSAALAPLARLAAAMDLLDLQMLYLWARTASPSPRQAAVLK